MNITGSHPTVNWLLPVVAGVSPMCQTVTVDFYDPQEKLKIINQGSCDPGAVQPGCAENHLFC